MFTSIETYEDPVTGCLDEFRPLCFATKANDADNHNWYQAANGAGADADGFWEAIWLEMVTLIDKKQWTSFLVQII